MSRKCNGCGDVIGGNQVITFKTSASSDLVFCGSCIRAANKALDEIDSKSTISLLHNSPEEIYHHISRKVIGQETAKKAISHAVARHFRKIKSKNKIKKANVLIHGPTGTGKTHMARAAAEILKVPFCEYSCTDLTPNGYVGDSVANIFQRLITAAGGDVEAAKNGVVFLDEVDKLKGGSGAGEKDLGTLTQANLLKVLEGADIEVKVGDSKTVTFNTTNVLFVLAGAFVGLTKNTEKDKIIGLAAAFADSNENESFEEGESPATAEDLEKFGFIPEFVGRVAIIGRTKNLSADDMKKILLDSEDSCLTQQVHLFAEDGVTLTFSDELIEEVVEGAMNNNTGARGLDREIESRLVDAFFNISKYKNKTVKVGRGGAVEILKEKKAKTTAA